MVTSFYVVFFSSVWHRAIYHFFYSFALHVRRSWWASRRFPLITLALAAWIVGGMDALDSIYFSTVLERAVVAERTTAVAAIGISRNS